MAECKVGDLVHIPQASVLIDCEDPAPTDIQLTIPLRIIETEVPTVGVVTRVAKQEGYVRVYCDGNYWSIKDSTVYPMREAQQ